MGNSSGHQFLPSVGGPFHFLQRPGLQRDGLFAAIIESNAELTKTMVCLGVYLQNRADRSRTRSPTLNPIIFGEPGIAWQTKSSRIRKPSSHLPYLLINHLKSKGDSASFTPLYQNCIEYIPGRGKGQSRMRKGKATTSSGSGPNSTLRIGVSKTFSPVSSNTQMICALPIPRPSVKSRKTQI